MSVDILPEVPTVDIDPSGIFKYTLIRLDRKSADVPPRYLVRGYDWAEYHNNIFEHSSKEIKSVAGAEDVTLICVGGGRIEHNPEERSILVYGYSMGFGRADHSITVDLLKKAFPDYADISFSNEGY